jgi:hypothetical protein
MNDQSKWKPPAELSGGAWRETRLTGAGIGVAILAALLFAGSLAAGFGLSRLRARQAAEQVALRETGVEARAVVTRHWRTGGKDDIPKIGYSFECQGQRCSGTAKTPHRIWQTLAVGDSIPVRFVPSNPLLNHPADWEFEVMPGWVPGVLAAALTLPGLLIVFLIRRQTRLLADGRPALATITGYRRVQHGRKMLKYEFKTLDGAVVKGHGGQTRRPPAIGSTLTVLYDRDNPKRNAPYPLELVRIDR